jgi:hypothetical protein
MMNSTDEAPEVVDKPGPLGDPGGIRFRSPRCGAKTRRGTVCKAAAMKNSKGKYTRCKFHGGASTGPRTPEGLARSKRARWTHGRSSAEAKQKAQELRREIRSLITELNRLTHEMEVERRERERQEKKAHGRTKVQVVWI